MAMEKVRGSSPLSSTQHSPFSDQRERCWPSWVARLFFVNGSDPPADDATVTRTALEYGNGAVARCVHDRPRGSASALGEPTCQLYGSFASRAFGGSVPLDSDPLFRCSPSSRQLVTDVRDRPGTRWTLVDAVSGHPPWPARDALT